MMAIQRSNDEERRRRNTECKLHEVEEHLRRARKETALARVRYRQSQHARTHEARTRSQRSEHGTVPLPIETGVAASSVPCALRPWDNFKLVKFLQDSGRPDAATACFANHLTGDDLSTMDAAAAALLLRLPSESEWPSLRKEIESHTPDDYRAKADRAGALDSHRAGGALNGCEPFPVERADLPKLYVYEVWAWGLGGWGFYQRKGEIAGTQLILQDASRRRVVSQYEIANGLYSQLPPDGADSDSEAEDDAPERRWLFTLKLRSGEELTMYTTDAAHRDEWLGAFRRCGCADAKNFEEGKVTNVEHRSSVRSKEDGVGFVASNVTPYMERTLKQLEEERLLLRSLAPERHQG
jgi:hypothetical protein